MDIDSLNVMQFEDAAAQVIREGEGYKPYMYLDSEDNVTIGYGFKLLNAESTTKFQFYTIKEMKPVDSSLVFKEFKIVKNKHKHEQVFYIKRNDAVQHLYQLIEEILYFLEEKFQTKWAYFPNTVKIAIIDMCYNLGLTGFFTKFPKCLTAIKGQDWDTAAKECHRKQVSEERNKLTADLFLYAKNPQDKKINSNTVKLQVLDDIDVDGEKATQVMAGYDEICGTVRVIYPNIRSACLVGLFVAEAHRRQGIGSKLVDACSKIAANKGYLTLGVLIDRDNADVEQFYEKLDFQFSYQYENGDTLFVKPLNK